MIIRLILSWAILSLAGFVILYFLDKEERTWASLWSRRFAYCGIGAAIILSTVVFLERL